MPARFSAYPPDRAVVVRVLEDDRRYSVGRAEACAVRLDHDSVSRHHAEIVGNGDGWRLIDLGSKNGLRVDGPEVGAIPLRALLTTTLPIVFFGLTLRGLGLVLSLTITVLATTFAMRSKNQVVALSTTFVLVVACVAIFVFALGLPLPLFGPWIGGY